MIGFLYRLIVGTFHRCDHKWDTVEVIQVEDRVGGVLRRYKRYVLRCKHCGEIKCWEVG